MWEAHERHVGSMGEIFGDVHEVPPDHELKMGLDGKGLVVKKNERVIEKDGKLIRPN